MQRSRHALNADTIREMHAAFRRGGRKAIETVMRNQPAVFLKLLVLLVPREMKLEHSGGVKAMTDEEIERGIERIKAMWSGKLRPMPKSFKLAGARKRRHQDAQGLGSALLKTL